MAKIIKKLIALVLLVIFVLVFLLEAGYSSSIQTEQKASCPDGYVAEYTPGGVMCVEKASFCGCQERYIIVGAESEDVVCMDLAPVNVTLGGRI